jgi:hypothetical protein
MANHHYIRNLVNSLCPFVIENKLKFSYEHNEFTNREFTIVLQYIKFID